MVQESALATRVTSSRFWQYKLVRYAAFHIPVGVLNYGIAFSLYVLTGVDILIASTAGHCVHVYFGYFHDKDVTFRKPGVDPKKAKIKYWVIEVFSYGSILLTVYVAYHINGINEYLARGVYAMAVGTAICLAGHQFWSFGKEKKSG